MEEGRIPQSQWKWERPPLTCGILVMCDRNQEWLLPWWWKRLQAVGNYAVAFVDLGMSDEGRLFCEQHGILIQLEELPKIAERADVEPSLASLWEKIYGPNLWQGRLAWYTKPFALLQSPFQHTLYLDLDCEVISSLDPLFQPCEEELVIAREPYDYAVDHPLLEKGERIFNLGVILYRHGSSKISSWAESVHQENHRFFGDSELLSHLAAKHDWQIGELPWRFHVRPLHGVPLDAAIIHWAGAWGKNFIREQGGALSVLPVLHLETRLWTFEEKR